MRSVFSCTFRLSITSVLFITQLFAGSITLTAAQEAPAADYFVYMPGVYTPIQTIIPNTTKVLTAQTTAHLVSISADGAIFTFNASTPELAALQPGDVMVGDVSPNAPHGFLRRVISVNASGGQVIVATGFARLDEAIAQGRIHVSHTLDASSVQNPVLLEGVTFTQAPLGSEATTFFHLVDVLLYDLDGNPTTTNDQIHATGSIWLDQGFDFDLEIGWFSLDELSFTTWVVAHSELMFSYNAEVVNIDEEIVIADLPLPSFSVPIGVVPVVFTPMLSVHVGLDGSVTGSATMGFIQEGSLEVGLQYADDDWSPVQESDWYIGEFDTAWTADLEVVPYAGVKLQLLIYGTVGPYATVNIRARLETSYNGACYDLDLGLAIPVGISVEVLGEEIASYEATPVDVWWNIFGWCWGGAAQPPGGRERDHPAIVRGEW